MVGRSDVSFSKAARNAVRVAAMSIRDIQDVEVHSSTAEAAPDDEVSLYKVDCTIGFAVEVSQTVNPGG